MHPDLPQSQYPIDHIPLRIVDSPLTSERLADGRFILNTSPTGYLPACS